MFQNQEMKTISKKEKKLIKKALESIPLSILHMLTFSPEDNAKYFISQLDNHTILIIQEEDLIPLSDIAKDTIAHISLIAVEDFIFKKITNNPFLEDSVEKFYTIRKYILDSLLVENKISQENHLLGLEQARKETDNIKKSNT